MLPTVTLLTLLTLWTAVLYHVNLSVQTLPTSLPTVTERQDEVQAQNKTRSKPEPQFPGYLHLRDKPSYQGQPRSVRHSRILACRVLHNPAPPRGYLTPSPLQLPSPTPSPSFRSTPLPGNPNLLDLGYRPCLPTCV